MKRFIEPDIILYIFLLILGIGGFFPALIWPETIGFYSYMMAAALGGVGVTTYIWYGKHFKDHLACPTGSDCNAVVNSKYSNFLGIHLEYLGALYYLTVFLTYLSFLLNPNLRETFLLPTILILTAFAFVFSLYLIFIQAAVLKKWCIWCLLSAALSTAIFVASLSSIGFATEFLGNITGVFMMLRSLGFVVGLGGATAATFIFFRFLDDMKIDDKEAQILVSMSEMIWLGLALTLISMYAMFVGSPETLRESSSFIMQIISLSVVFVSGAVLNTLFAPFLSVFPFGNEGNKPMPSLSSLRKSAVITGSITLSSWYFSFFAGYLSADFSITKIFLIYIIIIGVSLITALAINQELS